MREKRKEINRLLGVFASGVILSTVAVGWLLLNGLSEAPTLAKQMVISPTSLSKTELPSYLFHDAKKKEWVKGTLSPHSYGKLYEAMGQQTSVKNENFSTLFETTPYLRMQVFGAKDKEAVFCQEIQCIPNLGIYRVSSQKVDKDPWVYFQIEPEAFNLISALDAEP